MAMQVSVENAGHVTIGQDINIVNGPQVHGRRNDSSNGERGHSSANQLATDSSLVEDPRPVLPAPTPVAEESQPSDDYRTAVRQNSLIVDGVDQGADDPTAMENLKLQSSHPSRFDDLSIEHPQRDIPRDCTAPKVLATCSTSALQHGLDSSSSLTIDGPGESVRGNSVVVPSLPSNHTQNIYTVHHNSFRLHNSNQDVYSVFVKSFEDVLENASSSESFKDGVSPLLQFDWYGEMNFDLTKWKLTLKSGASGSSQLKDLTKQLCQSLKTHDIQCVRKVLEQLHQVHAAFLCSLSWDGGLVIFLGHADREKRPEFFQSPAKEQVQTILLQLLPDWCMDILDWEMPTIYDEEDKEDGGQSPRLDVNNAAISGDISSAPRNGSSFIKAPSLSKGNLLPIDSSFLDSASSRESYSSSSDLSQVLERVIENKVLGYLTSKQEPQPVVEKMAMSEKKLVKMMEDLTLKCQKQVEELERKHSAKTAEREQAWSKKFGDLHQSYDSKLADVSKQLELSKQEGEERMNQCMQQQETLNRSEEVSKKCEELRKTLREEVAQDLQKQSADMKGQLEQLSQNLQILQDNIFKQTNQQASLMEVHKLRKEMEERFKNLLNGSGRVSGTVGMAYMEDIEGAVGGIVPTRNKFSQALSETEQTMSKLTGKGECVQELASNQFEDKMHLPDTQPFSGTLHGETGSCSATPQDGAGSKAVQSDSQSAGTNISRGQDSPPTQRKQGEGNTQNRSRTSSPTSSTEGSGEDDADIIKAEEFLNWINISDNLGGSKDMKKILLKHIKAALKKEEVPAPRAKCLDTILCLDVSDSIVSAGHLDTVKQTALDFVDGVEGLMVEMDLEENVAVVALGGHARVVQHLTNDLTLVREAIDSLDDSGGRSPFMQALLVCFAANKGRGGIVSISGVYKVRPRIIFITDGYLTDESQETGPDFQSNQTQTNFCMVQLLSQLASKKHRSIPYPIDWVPIGKANSDFMKSMADLSGGELVAPGNISSRCRYYKIQQTIGRLFKMVKNRDSTFTKEDKIKELMVAIVGDSMSQEEKNFIMKEVVRLQQAPVEEEELEPDDFDNVFEDEEKLKDGELLCLGTRVKRGPDWKWKNQDTDGYGTVVQHNKKNNWIYIKWDNGICNAYRYNEDNNVDVQEIQHRPRQIPADSERLDFGVRVVRGPDWKWDNLDGKGPGTVIRVRDSDGRVKVRWDRTGKIFKYKYGPDVKEVQILSPEFPRGNAGPSKAQNPEQPVDDTANTIAMWQWRDEKRQWRLYEEHISEKLEAEYRKRPTASCVIHRGGVSRRVSFKLWQDKAVDNGSTTEVRREMVDEEKKNDLLAIELSLQDG